MNLEALGWNPHFAFYFDEHKLPDTEAARVTRVDRGRYMLAAEGGDWAGEVTGAFRHQTTHGDDYPNVGDWVVAEQVPGEAKALIHRVLPRRTAFRRGAVGDTSEVQLVAANVDVVFLVSGLDHDFNVRRIERFLALAWDSGARPVIVLNKADLCEALAERIQEVEMAAMATPVHAVSALSGDGIEALRRYLQAGTTVSFLGSSGVGKSSLVNRLAGMEVMSTGAVREDDSRGRHTTTHRQLVVLPQGGVIIDTPGMREIQLTGGEAGVATTFADIVALAEECRFRDCTHHDEPGCAVREAIALGTLDAGRLRSYRKLEKEAAFQERRHDEGAKHLERKHSKTLGKMYKRIQKEKGNR